MSCAIQSCFRWKPDVGEALFSVEIVLGFFPGLLPKSAQLLDLRDLSPSAAGHVLKLWVRTQVPGISCRHPALQSLKIITGRGNSRKAWNLRDVRGAVADSLTIAGVPFDQTFTAPGVRAPFYPDEVKRIQFRMSLDPAQLGAFWTVLLHGHVWHAPMMKGLPLLAYELASTTCLSYSV